MHSIHNHMIRPIHMRMKLYLNSQFSNMYVLDRYFLLYGLLGNCYIPPAWMAGGIVKKKKICKDIEKQNLNHHPSEYPNHKGQNVLTKHFRYQPASTNVSVGVHTPKLVLTGWYL